MIRISKRNKKKDKYGYMEVEIYIKDDENFKAEEILDEVIVGIKKKYKTFAEKMNLRIRKPDKSFCRTIGFFEKEHCKSFDSEVCYFNKIFSVLRKRIKSKLKKY